MGNIAESLVREGFARCVDWSMAMVSKDKDKLRAAEKCVFSLSVCILQNSRFTSIIRELPIV